MIFMGISPQFMIRGGRAAQPAGRPAGWFPFRKIPKGEIPKIKAILSGKIAGKNGNEQPAKKLKEFYKFIKSNKWLLFWWDQFWTQVQTFPIQFRDPLVQTVSWSSCMYVSELDEKERNFEMEAKLKTHDPRAIFCRRAMHHTFKIFVHNFSYKL